MKRKIENGDLYTASASTAVAVRVRCIELLLVCDAISLPPYEYIALVREGFNGKLLRSSIEKDIENVKNKTGLSSSSILKLVNYYGSGLPPLTHYAVTQGFF